MLRRAIGLHMVAAMLATTAPSRCRRSAERQRPVRRCATLRRLRPAPLRLSRRRAGLRLDRGRTFTRGLRGFPAELHDGPAVRFRGRLAQRRWADRGRDAALVDSRAIRKLQPQRTHRRIRPPSRRRAADHRSPEWRDLHLQRRPGGQAVAGAGDPGRRPGQGAARRRPAGGPAGGCGHQGPLSPRRAGPQRHRPPQPQRGRPRGRRVDTGDELVHQHLRARARHRRLPGDGPPRQHAAG
jgi:hypothetical protein